MRSVVLKRSMLALIVGAFMLGLFAITQADADSRSSKHYSRGSLYFNLGTPGYYYGTGYYPYYRSYYYRSYYYRPYYRSHHYRHHRYYQRR